MPRHLHLQRSRQQSRHRHPRNYTRHRHHRRHDRPSQTAIQPNKRASSIRHRQLHPVKPSRSTIQIRRRQYTNHARPHNRYHRHHRHHNNSTKLHSRLPKNRYRQYHIRHLNRQYRLPQRPKPHQNHTNSTTTTIRTPNLQQAQQPSRRQQLTSILRHHQNPRNRFQTNNPNPRPQHPR